MLCASDPHRACHPPRTRWSTSGSAASGPRPSPCSPPEPRRWSAGSCRRSRHPWTGRVVSSCHSFQARTREAFWKNFSSMLILVIFRLSVKRWWILKWYGRKIKLNKTFLKDFELDMSKLLLTEEQLSFSHWIFYVSDHLAPIIFLSFHILNFNCYKVRGHAFFSSLRHWEFETEWAWALSIWGRTFSFCLSLTASFRPRSRLGVQADRT